MHKKARMSSKTLVFMMFDSDLEYIHNNRERNYPSRVELATFTLRQRAYIIDFFFK